MSVVTREQLLAAVEWRPLLTEPVDQPDKLTVMPAAYGEGAIRVSLFAQPTTFCVIDRRGQMVTEDYLLQSQRYDRG